MVDISPKPHRGTASRAKPKQVRVKIGGVIVSSDRPTAAAAKRGLDLSNAALQRLATTIVKPGVKLGRRPGVPLYSADPDRPDRVIRKLNGKVDRGVLENGKFKADD